MTPFLKNVNVSLFNYLTNLIFLLNEILGAKDMIQNVWKILIISLGEKCPNTECPYLDTFHTVFVLILLSFELENSLKKCF